VTGSSVYFGGKPVGPDVQKLMDAIGTPAPGQDIEHSEVEAALGLGRREPRYGVVTRAWRRRLADLHSLEVGAVKGEGFRCLKPNERIESSSDKMKGAVRQTKAAVEVAVLTAPDLLDAIGKVQRGHLINFGSAVVQQHHDMRRTMRAELPEPASRPQIAAE
jgi:hypothetical protein